MNRKIKLIGYDLDGTLLSSEKKLTEYTKNVMEKAIGQGVVLVPTTGRPLNGIPREVREFPGVRYVIASNGARIVKNGETIHETLLPVRKAEQILEIFEDYDTVQEVYYSGQGFAPRYYFENMEKYMPNPAMAEYVRTTRQMVENVRAKMQEENRDLDKIQALFLTQEAKQEAWERIEALGNVEVTGALSTNIEVNAGGVHKGVALLWLAESLGIKKEEIMTFGDGANDIKMIQTAGVGVAMGNAVDEAKKAADLIAPTNDENGVAVTIEKYVLQ